MPLISTLGAASSRGFGEFNNTDKLLYVEDVFSTYLYDGTASSLTITNGINLLDKGGMLWTKARNQAYDNIIGDTNRGLGNYLSSDTNLKQNGDGTFFTVNANVNGYTISSDTNGSMNSSGNIFASWTFRKTAKFFDVVTYTGNGANRTISHNLGSVPGMIFVKRTDDTGNWAVYHRSLANTEYLVLNTTAAKATGATYWNSTTPTSTVFSLGTSTDVNANGGTYVAYLFAHDAGGFGLDGSQSVVSCGSVTTDGANAGSATLGWEPQFVLLKTSTGGANTYWYIWDNIRGIPIGTVDSALYANSAAAEDTLSNNINLNPTGFSVSLTASQTYVYMAIRRGPMAVPTDATKVFMPTVYTGTNVDNRLVNTTIAPDMVWVRQRNDTVLGGMVVGDRIRGNPYMLTGTTAAEVNDADSFMTPTASYGNSFSAMNGFGCGNDVTSKLNANTTSNNHIAEAFKRAPGFFDMVAYTGTGANRTISHNLGVVPQLIMIKQRASTTAWAVYSSGLLNTEYLVLNSTAARATGATYWNSTTPTTSVFSLGTSTSVNANAGTYIAYLFATCPGVSSVGSYIGTGTTNQINCGFTSGARLVLIKRVDTTGDWYIWDSARGIVAGNDPYILLNSTAAEVTSTDYVDTYSSGFELSSTAPAGLNEAPGITWVSRTSGFGTTTIRGLTYGGGLFVAVGSSGVLTTSPDAITWTSQTSGFGSANINAVTYGNGLYVAVGTSGTMTTSSDAITWTAQTSGFGTTAINAVTYGNGLYVAGGAAASGGVTIMTTSTDGITWTQRTSGFPSGTSITGLTYGGGLFVAVGGGGSMSTSTDGITWTSRTSGFGSTTIRAVTYGNGLYVAVGDSGTMTTSTDGITWTSRTSGFGTTQILSVTYGNGLFVAAGASGTLTTSTDGITWTSRTSGFGAENIQALTYQNNIFVAGGTTGVMRTNSPSYIYLAIA